MMFDGLNLNLIWFFLVGILFTGYAILDGFDLGVGALHLFVKSDSERRLMMNSIGPVWDGNEVWLVTAGGALFAAFPETYATVFSGFYLPFIFLLFALIFRAVAIEFRSKLPMPWWRQLWDVSFSASSIIGALLLGITLGNIAMGIPLGPDHEFAGTLLDLLNPYAFLVGITTVSLFIMHASIFLVLKTEGEMQAKIRSWVKDTIAVFVICYVTTTMATLLYVPVMTQNIRTQPVFFILALLNMLAIANIPREIYHNRDFRAFAFSCLNIILLLSLFGLGVFPYMLLSIPNPEYSLTIYNAASSQQTLAIMLTITIIGVPLVLTYTASIYWIFRGKVKLDASSY